MVKRLSLALLLVALLLAQTLGQLHRYAHAPELGGLAAAAASRPATSSARLFPGGTALHADAAPTGAAGPAAWPLLTRLFHAHQQAADCRLYDQLCAADGVTPVQALALPLPLPAQLVRFFAGAELARRAALFDARGPPAAL